MRSENSA
ncbi:Protein of unknown function [Pyronema omphalodes CBS 100304]|nr:Protein of unknown function [Pyronema omphalodes CBS 100304]